MFRRKVLAPDLAEAEAAFHAVLEVLEPAKAGLADVLPGTRMPGRPLQDALEAFGRSLAAAEERMARWRRPELEAEWLACEAGIERAQARVRSAGVGDEPAAFEGLLGLVTSLLDPLEPFADAEDRFRRLRR
jgi:hypothetical protein